jgi:hypothetical protein
MRADGQATLMRAIANNGGFQRWASEFDLPRAKPSRPRRPPRLWSTERIAAELAAFCQHRDTFPSPREFEDAELSGLHSAIHRHGGPNWWAQQFGLARIKPNGAANQDHPIPGRLFPITDIPPSTDERPRT